MTPPTVEVGIIIHKKRLQYILGRTSKCKWIRTKEAIETFRYSTKKLVIMSANPSHPRLLRLLLNGGNSEFWPMLQWGKVCHRSCDWHLNYVET